MIIYKCAISEDEMFSDAFKCKEVENGIFYEVEGKMVTRKGGIDGDLIGANPSADEMQESTDEVSDTGIDIILNHGLVEIKNYDKKEYKAYVKPYVKAVKAYLEENNPGRVKGFMADVQPAILKIIGDFSNFQVFRGPSLNDIGMLGLLNFREDGITPYMLFFKDGLIVEKC